MKTKTYVYISHHSDDIKKFIDELYENYGERVVNWSIDGPSTDYVLFYTIREDDKVKPSENID